jgi:L-iditol 2-dehydrogenase
MPDTMKAAVMYGIDDIRIEQVPMAQLAAPDWALVRIGAVGICGSDIHFLEEGRIGCFVVEGPLILGHESAGTVVEVGAEVRGLAPGDRVAVEPGYPCRKCEFCKTGRYNLCADVTFLACPPTNGVFCEYLAWPADFLFKLPDNVSLEEGAMIEPFSVGLHAARRAGIRAGETVAVLGSGPIGLCALQAARASGATTVIVADLEQSRLDRALGLGAGDVVNLREADPVEAIVGLTNGRGVDVVLECSGSVPALQTAVRVARRGGTVQLVGNFSVPEPNAPIQELIERELNLSGLFRYANCYGASVELIADGKVDTKSLITHRYSLDETLEAMRWVSHNKDKVIKGVIAP